MIPENQRWPILLLSLLSSACEKPKTNNLPPSQDKAAVQDRTVHELSEQERCIHVLKTLVKEYEQQAATVTGGHDEAKMSALAGALRLQLEKLPGGTDLSDSDIVWRDRANWIIVPREGAVPR
jgi:hypothetical protein